METYSVVYFRTVGMQMEAVKAALSGSVPLSSMDSAGFDSSHISCGSCCIAEANWIWTRILVHGLECEDVYVCHVESI